jgi:uncharacterized protein (TIGR03067 family)
VSRVLVSLVVLVAVTAFAPAPFPRLERKRVETIDLAALRGLWRAVSIEEVQPDGSLKGIPWRVRHVRIEEDRWAFGSEISPAALRISLDRTHRPIVIDLLTSAQNTAMAGVLKLEGDRLLMLYTFHGPSKRPTDFARKPAGTRLMTLQRER